MRHKHLEMNLFLQEVNKKKKAKSESQAIRSQVLRQKSQPLRNKIFKSCDKENI